jgi:hypothetical protein
MCELTLVNTGDVRRNRAIAYSLAFVNSFKHKDGTGFSHGMYVWKTYLQACSITNLYPSLVRYVKDDRPIIVHTRFATMGASAGKEISDENAHPFKGGNHVLAHNGTLTPRVALTAEQKKEIGNMTDSEYFFKQLEKCDKPDLIEALNETMKGFTGKFAFLIYDDTKKKHFAIRGHSANLFWVPITSWVDGKEVPVGFVTNTEKDDLIRGLVLAKNLCSQAAGFDFDLTKIAELDKETAYDMDGLEPVKAGTVKENFIVAATYAAVGVGYQQGSTGGWSQNNSRSSTTPTSNTTTKALPGQAFINFCMANAIDQLDADMLVLSFTGKTIAGLDNTEIKWLDEVVTPALAKRTDKRKTEIWNDLLLLYTDQELYKSGVAFPYFLEDFGALKKLLNQNKRMLYKKGDKTNAQV